MGWREVTGLEKALFALRWIKCEHDWEHFVKNRGYDVIFYKRCKKCKVSKEIDIG